MRALVLVLLLLPGLARAQAAFSGYYPEGPVWIGKTLYWAEMGGDRVMAWTGGEPRVAWSQAGCGPSALARYQRDRIVVLCHYAGALASYWTVNAQLPSMIVARPRDDHAQQLRNSPSSTASADGRGGVWFTDPGPFSKSAGAVGRIYHLAADGRLTRQADGLFYGNGVHVDQAGRRLLVSEHLARRVLAYPLAGSEIGAPEVLFELDAFGLAAPRYDHAGPDGLEIAPDGTLWFAEYGTSRLMGWDAAKGLVAATATDAQFITNIAFGPDGLVAVTAPKNNTQPPFPGIIWIFEIETLDALKTR